MPIYYALYENHLTVDPNDYRAVIQNQKSKGQDDIIELMISRGSTLTKAEVLSTLEELAQTIEQLVKEGYPIHMPLFRISFSIKGVFTSEEENFNPSRHSVKINVSPGPRLKQMAGGSTVSRVQASRPRPDPVYLDDLGSKTRNKKLTAGNIAQLKGSRLKFDPADPAQGIFLIAADSSETRVATVSRNKPSQLDFLVPPLATGTYQVEVRAILHNTKNLRKGKLASELSTV